VVTYDRDWIMIGYFETTPMELEESALIDGATAGRSSVTSRCRSRGRASPSRSSWRDFSWNNFVFASCWPDRDAHPAVASTT